MFQPILRVGGLRLIPVFLLLSAWACHGQQDRNLQLTWKDNLLRVHADYLPGGSVEIWYLEVFCRKGATNRKWNETVIPHSTELIFQSEERTELRLQSRIDPGVIATHSIRTETDEVRFDLEFLNPTHNEVDIQWAQPCIRVGRFTGLEQRDYWTRSFVFVEGELKFLHQIPRTKEALYLGGQVYVPKGVDRQDVNPRPISSVTPDPPIIGCLSNDNRWLIGTAWDSTQELFQGVITCIHSDFRIGGLQAGERKRISGRIYLLPNDPDLLVDRWLSDFK